jgi:hypothetical protein
VTEHRQKLRDVYNDPTETRRDPCRWFLKKHPNSSARLDKGFMHVGLCNKDGTMRYMHCDIEVSNEDIKESNGEESETIEKWKFCSSVDEGSFSKICRAILHPILFRGKRDKTETSSIKKYIDYYIEKRSQAVEIFYGLATGRKITNADQEQMKKGPSYLQ